MDPAKTCFWREGEIPWPTSWKKPLVLQALATSVTMARPAGELGSVRKGEMSTVGIVNLVIVIVINIVAILVDMKFYRYVLYGKCRLVDHKSCLIEVELVES